MVLANRLGKRVLRYLGLGTLGIWPGDERSWNTELIPYRRGRTPQVQALFGGKTNQKTQRNTHETLFLGSSRSGYEGSVWRGNDVLRRALVFFFFARELFRCAGAVDLQDAAFRLVTYIVLRMGA